MTFTSPLASASPGEQKNPESLSAPLTHAQESLYFLQQLTQGEPVYNMPQAFRLRGSLNVAALEGALRLLLSRHEALRSNIIESATGPTQVVRSDEELCFRIHDLKTVPTPDREGALQHLLEGAIREPFDLNGGVVCRADLFEVSGDDHALLLNIHHIVGDMASLGIIFSELSESYEALCKGRAPSLAPNVVQLRSFAAERRKNEASPELIGFWRENLAGFTSELDLPLDRFRPKMPTFKGAAYYFDLPSELRNQLGELARKSRSSLYMLCLSALEALLYRYTGQERFAIATPFTEREDPRLEHTIGYLINLLPIPCEVRAEQNFRELLAAVRAKCLAIYTHHDVSFRRIISELGLSTEHPKPPLARVVFQYFPESASLELSQLRCEPIRVHTQTSKFDLCLSMAEHGGTITTEIEFDTDIYNESTVRRIACHFQNLLSAIAANPDQEIGALNLIDPEERDLLGKWNDTSRPYPREKSVHLLFEEEAERHPQAIALSFEGRKISYEVLNREAN
ncbi:MAG TPA: condensation domain-containing protein, partial [Verrucomicrobiae bacterium]|nr:condensation domain-containing protein [Verrucomicrobiae bacterium]